MNDLLLFFTVMMVYDAEGGEAENNAWLIPGGGQGALLSSLAG